MKRKICNGESETAKRTPGDWMKRVANRLELMDLSHLAPDDRNRIMWEKAMVHVDAYNLGEVELPLQRTAT